MSVTDIPTTLGALLVGGFFATMLSGIVNLQTMLYFKSYKTDPVRLKVTVLVAWGLDNLHTAFIWGGLWEYLIQNYGKTDSIDFIPWNISLTVILTATVTFLVHCFFAHRIYMLSKKNWFMTSPVIIFAVLRIGAASVSTWEMFHYQSFDLFKLHARWIFTLGLSVSSAVDILITGCLFYLFQSNRPEAGDGTEIVSSYSMNKVIDKLMLYAFETGSLTCIGTIVSMIRWVAMSQNLIFLGLHFVIGKLYANSLLVTLNTRENIRRARSTSTGEQGPVVFLESRRQKTSEQYFGSPSTKVPTELQISVETSVHYESRSIDV
ncbi:hypothetical protein B0H10DRAFT_2218573 [Mycena sp. CBHHK59/15]|nr:hypothetical protein B0H10DRAFT_2218573 [Mycena sp. CBHHK59/15]